MPAYVEVTLAIFSFSYFEMNCLRMLLCTTIIGSWTNG